MASLPAASSLRVLTSLSTRVPLLLSTASLFSALQPLNAHRKYSNECTPKVNNTDDLHVAVEPLSEPYVGVSVISLNRPQARNAMGRQLLSELREAIYLLSQERTTRCVIVRSLVPGVFCAGADLKERFTMSQAETQQCVNMIRSTMTMLEELPMPTVAAVEGYALGGGLELALACDMRVLGDSAILALPEVGLGTLPGAGGTQRLPRLIGMARAKELIFSSKKVTASEAVQMGLANCEVPAGKAYDYALEMAFSIAQGAPLALRMAKAAINQGMNMNLHNALQLEEAFYAQIIPSKDRTEGLNAFKEKRPPQYTGE